MFYSPPRISKNGYFNKYFCTFFDFDTKGIEQVAIQVQKEFQGRIKKCELANKTCSEKSARSYVSFILTMKELNCCLCIEEILSHSTFYCDCYVPCIFEMSTFEKKVGQKNLIYTWKYEPLLPLKRH